MTIREEQVLSRVRDFFTQSRDNNGIIASRLASEMELTWDELRPVIASLVLELRMTLTFSSLAINPHIKRIPDVPAYQQLDLLDTEQPTAIGLYPSTDELRPFVDTSTFAGRPYSLRLALGDPQLLPIAFELKVFERYLPDPRYRFVFADYAGFVEDAPEYHPPEKSETTTSFRLKTFGIAYDPQLNRVAVVFLRYLAKLSATHQQHFATFEEAGTFAFNSAYAANFDGDFPEGTSIYEAVLGELRELNKLSALLDKPPLFKNAHEVRPHGFHATLLPTRARFFAFMQLFDQLLSDNINFKFFEGEIESIEVVPRSDGTVETVKKGSLRMLAEWLEIRFGPNTPPGKTLLTALKSVRDLRNKQSHKIEADVYSLEYANEQDRVVSQVVHCLFFLRTMFELKVEKGKYHPPDWLEPENLKIW